MTSDFYRAFEDKYRGGRDLIKSRLKVYLPFLEPLKTAYPDCQALDLGCGRGEWLELLRDLGISAHGVDLDSNMLSVCQDLNLSVTVDNAITYLQKLPNESQISVSGFHIAEHLNFDDLQILVQESQRVLKPGGLLILETPNPENIIVASCSFYLDPTHQRPIPPDLLLFLAEYYKFSKFKILRLNESQELIEGQNLSLLDILKNVSPDYALIAQKRDALDTIDCTDEVFEVDYGVTLEQLAARYYQQTENQRELLELLLKEIQQRERLELLLKESQQQRERLELLLKESQQQRERLELLFKKSQQQQERLELLFKESQQQLEQVQVVLQTLLNSRSMRLTLPLRLAAHHARSLKQRIKESLGVPKLWVKQSAKRVLINLAYQLSGKPQLKFIALNLLRYSPNLKHRLKLLTLTSGSSHAKDLEPTHISTLSPHAARIFYDLKEAIQEAHRSGGHLD